MKYLLIIFSSLLAITVHAQIVIGSTGAAEPVGNFPVAFSKNIKGAPQRVSSLAERDAIPMSIRDTGMLCYVTSVKARFFLDNGIDNSNWKLDSIGSGSTTIISNGGGNAVTRTATANGNSLVITVYTGTGLVTGVSSITENGSGLQYYAQDGDSLHIYYGDAPEGDIIYRIGIIGDITNAFVPCDPVKYGALFTNATDLSAGSNLGLQYLRTGYSGGNTVTYPNYTGAGYKVLLTYNTAVSTNGNYTALPTDTTAFKNKMDSILALYGTTNLEGIALINEPNNIKHGTGYWQPNAQNYLNLLKAATGVAHKYGLKIGDGGFTGEILYYMAYEDLLNRGFADSAADFAARAFPNTGGLSGWRTDTGHGYRIAFVDSLIKGIAAMNVDFVNFHFYETNLDKDSLNTTINPLTFKQIAWYLRRVTGKKVITNEFGLNNNTNADIMAQLIDAVEELHAADANYMEYAMWYSGNPNYTLANVDGSLTELGQAFRDKIKDEHVDL